MPLSSPLGVVKMEKTVIDGVEIKVGDKIAWTQWLAFAYVVVDIPAKNVLKIAGGMCDPRYASTLKKGRKYWSLDGRRGVSVNLRPNHDEIEAHNDAIRASERWMCM